MYMIASLYLYWFVPSLYSLLGLVSLQVPAHQPAKFSTLHARLIDRVLSAFKVVSRCYPNRTGELCCTEYLQGNSCGVGSRFSSCSTIRGAQAVQSHPALENVTLFIQPSMPAYL
jgi:hypothetical protein